MNVALCLSGLTRSINYGWPLMERYLVRPFNSKVFIHTWDIDHGGERPKLVYKSPSLPSFVDGTTKEQFLKNEIKAESFLIENYNEWSQINSSAVPKAMFYSLYKANDLKTQYENKMQTRFDLVIRLRMDFFFESWLPQNEIEEVLINNKIVYGCLPGNKPDSRFFTDAFGFGTSDTMNIYSSVWEDVKIHGLTRFPAELILQDKLIASGITFKWSKTRYRILNEWGNEYIRIWGDF